MKRNIKNFNDYLFEEIQISELPTNYDFSKYKLSNGITAYKYIFDTNRGNKYRFDLFEAHNLNTEKLNKYVDIDRLSIISLSFSLLDRSFDPILYNEPTNFNEQFEVLRRLIFISKEFINNHPEYNCYAISYDVSDENIKSKNDSINNKKNILYAEYCKYFSDDFLLVKEETNLISSELEITYILIKKEILN